MPFPHIRSNLGSLCFLLLLFNGRGTFMAQTQQHPQGSPQASAQRSLFKKGGDIFGTRNFIENKGQFNRDVPGGEEVYFKYEHGGEFVYFTQSGLVFVLKKFYELTEEEREEAERGTSVEARPAEFYYVRASWLNAACKKEDIIPSGMQGHYFTYGTAEYNSRAFKTLTYRNVYPGIDIEYTLPEDKSQGIKYTLIVKPGAKPEQAKLLYSGDFRKIRLKEDGSLQLRTALNDIRDQAPQSFDENQQRIESRFVLRGDTLTFGFPQGYDRSKTLYIDPWVTAVPASVNNAAAFDVDYDFGGNTYIYGGNFSANQIAKFNVAGVHQWTFGGSIVTPNWSNVGSASNFGVDRFTGKSYTGQGVVGAGAQVIRLNTLGGYDNFITNQNSNYREIWDFGFHCTSGDVFIFGGSTAPTPLSAATINSVSMNLNVSNFQPSVMGCCQDVVNYAIDDQGVIFVVYAGNAAVHNKLCRVNPTFNGNIWTSPTGFNTLNENGNKVNFQPPATSNGLNCLAVNGSYLYYYDGLNLAAYNKLTGANIASITISGATVKRQAGIAVDDCNRLYLGGNGSIMTYSFSGSAFVSIGTMPLGINSPTLNVHDIKLDRNTKTLYVCGTGFVGTYQAALSMACPVPPSPCVFNQAGIGASTSSITCASLGSATVFSNGGLGPFSYTWIPSGITGPVASGLGPGTYTIAVHDAGYNATYTTTTTFLSPVPLTGTVSNTFMLACNGVNNGTAAVTALAGGSGAQTYTWTNGTSTHSTASVSNLGAGNYSLTVKDALTGCVFNHTFTIFQPSPFTTFISSSSPSACAGTSVDLYINSSGGVPVYSYSWIPGPANSTLQVSESAAGLHTYTALSTDANNCSNTATISIDFVPNPTLSVAHVSICPLETATLNASGASTYTWSNGSQSVSGSSYTQSPAVNSQYTVYGSALSCSAVATASILLKTPPNPVFQSNSPRCQGDQLNFSVNSGASFNWSGVNGFSSTNQNNSLSVCHPTQSGVYQVTVTAANSCTASAQGTLLVHPSPTLSATGASVCVNQTLQLSANAAQASFFVWSGPNFVSLLQNPVISNPQVNASGNYSVLATSAQNCTSQAVVQVSVTPLPLVSFSSNAPLCMGSTLSFNASATSGGIQFSWAGPNGFISNLQNPQIPNVVMAAAGDYSLAVSAGPCTVHAAQTVTVYPLPTAQAYNSGPVCEGKAFQVGVNNSGQSYLWLNPSGLVSSQQVQTFSSAQLNHGGAYTVQVTDANGCQASDVTSLTVLNNPTVLAFGDLVCFGEPAQLNASGADTYLWYGPLGFTAQTAMAQIPAALNTQPWTYTVIGTGVNGCTTVATTTIGTRPLPVAGMSITPRVCVKSIVNLKGEGGVAYLWTGPLNFSSTLQSFSFLAQNVGASGEYSLMVSDAYGCRAYARSTLQVDPEPSASLEGRLSGCVPFCSDYTLRQINTQSITNVRWQLEELYLTSPALSYCFQRSGNFEIKAEFESEQNCKGNFSRWIDVYPLPEADFSYSPLKPVENLDQVHFTSQSRGEKLSAWTWNFNDGHYSNVEGSSTSRPFEEAGLYVVVLKVKNNWDCLDTAIKTIEVLPDFHVYVPNAFTPNADGLNDFFFPVMRGVKRFSLQVFDRWGALIFSSNSPDNNWDGTYKGQACKQDVYNFTLQVLNNKGEEKEYKGSLMLYR